MESEHIGVRLDFDDSIITPSPGTIRRFADIPDILTMDIPSICWIVDGMISQGSMTLWAGADGVAKTYLAHSMAVAVATGGKFLGRRCRRTPVLIFDYENPSHAIRERLEMLSGEPIPTLKAWGTWLEHQPPQIGSELMLTIAKDDRPLMIFDPFRYAHGAEENDSTEMAAVMQQLRFCAAKGASVVLLHHIGKAENSTSRGSTAIRGAVDVAYLQSMDAESGLISLTCEKNRFGESHYTITIRPDFDEATFEVSDSPQFVRRNQELEALRKIISEQPGLSQNQIHQKAGMKRERVFKLLRENTGALWQVHEQGRSRLYFPSVPKDGNHPGNHGTTSDSNGGSMVPSLIKGTIGTTRPSPPNGSQSLVCPSCGQQGEWSTQIGLARHMAGCEKNGKAWDELSHAPVGGPK